MGAVAAARVPARPGHRRHRRGEPAGHRVHPGRPRDHRLGRVQRRMRGPLAGDHPHRGGVHRGERPPGSVRPGRRGLRAAARGAAPGPRGRAGAGDPRPGLDQPAAGGPLHRHRGRARLHVPGGAPAAGRAGHVLSRPLPAHQGAPDGPGPAAGRPAGGGGDPARRAARGLPRRLRGLLPAVRAPGLAPHARRRPGHRAGARRRDVQLRRQPAESPGSPGSSTSTRST